MTQDVIARDEQGRFPVGVSGNPAGRPKGKKNELTELKQDLEIAVRKNVDHEDVRDIIVAMIEKAKDGNVGAAKLILDKTISNAKESEDAFEGSGGITVIVKNATIQASRDREENERTIIDVTPREES